MPRNEQDIRAAGQNFIGCQPLLREQVPPAAPEEIAGNLPPSAIALYIREAARPLPFWQDDEHIVKIP